MLDRETLNAAMEAIVLVLHATQGGQMIVHENVTESIVFFDADGEGKLLASLKHHYPPAEGEYTIDAVGEWLGHNGYMVASQELVEREFSEKDATELSAQLVWALRPEMLRQGMEIVDAEEAKDDGMPGDDLYGDMGLDGPNIEDM